jgi:hypothetical protein
MRMAMAERIHCDAAREIEITFAIGPDQPGAFAAFECEIGPCENGQQMGRRSFGHDVLPVDRWSGSARRRCRAIDELSAPETKRAAFPGGT